MSIDLNPGWYRATVCAPAVAEKRVVRRAGGLDEYAHVRVWVQPAPKGSGNVLSWHAGSHIPAKFAGFVMEGSASALRSGIFGGIEFVDVCATVETGSYHESDSNGPAFQEAAENATAQALRQAQPLLLQAIVSITTSVPEEFTGAVESVVRGQGEVLQGVQAEGRIASLTANLAASKMRNVMSEVLEVTQGAARFSLRIISFVELTSGPHQQDDWAALT